MTYEEPDRGAELLKIILPLMSRHAAGYHPISYALWYEYAKGEKPALRESVDAELKKRQRLTVPITQSLYARFLVEPAEQLLLTARSNLGQLVEKVKQAVTQAGKGTAEFDAQLSEFQQEMACASSIEDLGGSVAAMQDGAKRASSDFGQLASQLDESQGEVRRLTEEMHKLQADTMTDALSGLLNRRGFDRKLEQLARQASAGACDLSLIMFDIDHFKRVNDSYGHPLGDRVIAAVGHAILDCVGDQGIAARYGGEEFAVLLPFQPIETAESIAQSIRQRVEQGKIRRRQGEEPIGAVTVSAGVAALRSDDDLGSLIERADRALYASKRSGRNRVTVDCT